jgi:sugar lactone lactonase YvrE
MNLAFARLGDCRPSLGEGPVWDDRRQCLFFVDIRAPAVHAIGLDGGGFRTWPMPSLTGSIGLAESGRIIVALQQSVAILDPDSGTLQPLVAIAGEPARNRLNDGKVGPDGAFWVGSMDMERDGRTPSGSLYRIDGRGHLSVARAHCVGVSNGLAWSGDGRMMFHADSHQGWIDRIDFDPASGSLGRTVRIVDAFAPELGKPDGAACDIEDGYWSAGVFGGRLNRWSPDGTLLGSAPLPVMTPTMPCFCGDDLKTLVLTSLQEPADGDPDGGILLIGRSPVAGVPVQRWQDL